MKTRLLILAIACLATLSIMSIRAMEGQASIKPTHRLVGIIKTVFFEKDHTDIFFVKELSNQHVVVFNRDGWGELFARQHPADDICNYKSIKNLMYERYEGDRPCDVFNTGIVMDKTY